jgi:nicotinamidase-related amidase
MRLPIDAALLVPDAGDATDLLLQAWREEALPVFPIGAHGESAFADSHLEANLDAIGATTLVFAGGFARARLRATALAAAERGYRAFVVSSEGESGELGGDVRVVSVETAIEAARRAKFRQRWALARRGG